MAISKLNFNSLNVTPSANSAIGFDSGADDLETGAGGGSMVFIKKLTASSSGTLSFVDGSSSVVLDNTYKEYVFTFKDIHPATDDVFLGHQGDVNGATTYGQTCTNTMFYARHGEGDSPAGIDIYSSADQAQGTGINKIVQLGNGSDKCGSGYLHIFNPSSTTFVKHFISCLNGYHPSDQSFQIFSAGYYNTTSALNTFQFKMTSGNIDAGTITLYGIT